MRGRVALVTGATDGIGRETALGLARLGAHVLVHGRNPGRCRLVVAEIEGMGAGGGAAALVADLSSLAEVRRLATEVLARTGPLHVLVNNAGVVMPERRITPDGLETTFAVNHLAPFLLTNLLRERLITSAPARVVTVSSTTHHNAEVEWDNLQGERSYRASRAYALSKLGNVLFAFELADRLRGSGVTSNCLHPGVIRTKLLRAGWGGFGGGSPSRGAQTSIYLASAREVQEISGRYFESLRPARPSPLAEDVDLRRRFWEISAQLAGLGE